MEISLRKSLEPDLEVFYHNQADEEANYMAAFTSKDPFDKDAFMKKWTRLMAVDSVHMQSILLDDVVIGCVVKFVVEGDSEITYALDKRHWGKGITSKAVKLFLEIEKTRPLYGRAAYDNYGSQKILEKAGFSKIGTNTDFANARGMEIEEYIYRLEE
ncbi:MAG: GNAT family N-acetyltransferase [Cyclobacteriaceae bacterium]|nr:GNAT family N-acetyltransferase [Cyclobacteriaceae bacterium HetDA_MAG_MS6]